MHNLNTITIVLIINILITAEKLLVFNFELGAQQFQIYPQINLHLKGRVDIFKIIRSLYLHRTLFKKFKNNYTNLKMWSLHIQKFQKSEFKEIHLVLNERNRSEHAC